MDIGKEGLAHSLNVGSLTNPIKPGAPRLLIDVQSNSSNINTVYNILAPSSYTRGKLYFASDTSRLLMWTSISSEGVGGGGPGSLFYKETTYQIGTPRFIEHATDPGKGVWIESSGFKKFSAPDGNSGNISFGNVIFDAAPNIVLWSSNTRYAALVRFSRRTSFDAKLNAIGTASDMTLFWRASGMSSGVV